MLELNVSNVPHATASDDGLALTIIFDLEDGGQARMHIPYGQYDWWIQAMQVVASAAFRKQVEAGRVTAIPNPVIAMQIADSVRIAKTAAARDAIDALLGFFEQAPGGFQPEHLDRLGRCAPRLSLVAPGEISWAHADAFGELIDIQSFVTEILRYPDVKVFEGRRGQGLRLQELAELRLSAWPL
jgi:hypothetical protein